MLIRAIVWLLAIIGPSSGWAWSDDPSSAPAAPEVHSISPPRAAQGVELTLKLKGKNFAPGVRVAFSNQGIEVSETKSSKRTELETRIKIAPDAPTGKTGLFVVNPDDSETEVLFEVTAAGEAPKTDSSAAKASKPGQPAPMTFEVLNLGDAASVLENSGKAKGTLTFASGKLKYAEGGKELFSAASRDIKEIDLNTYFGIRTPVFHVTLNSDKTFNFVATSLQVADSQSIVDSLHRALR